MMKREDIPDEKWSKLDKQTQVTMMDYFEKAFPDKGPSEKVEQWIAGKLKEVG